MVASNSEMKDVVNIVIAVSDGNVMFIINNVTKSKLEAIKDLPDGYQYFILLWRNSQPLITDDDINRVFTYGKGLVLRTAYDLRNLVIDDILSD